MLPRVPRYIIDRTLRSSLTVRYVKWVRLNFRNKSCVIAIGQKWNVLLGIWISMWDLQLNSYDVWYRNGSYDIIYMLIKD